MTFLTNDTLYGQVLYAYNTCDARIYYARTIDSTDVATNGFYLNRHNDPWTQ